MSTENNNHDEDTYIPPKDPKPSRVYQFVKFTLVIVLVLSVSSFLYCAGQLGQIGN